MTREQCLLYLIGTCVKISSGASYATWMLHEALTWREFNTPSAGMLIFIQTVGDDELARGYMLSKRGAHQSHVFADVAVAMRDVAWQRNTLQLARAIVEHIKGMVTE